MKLISCLDKNNGIGKNNSIPWLNDSLIRTFDLSLFKKLTKDHIIIMGNKTFQSLSCLLPYRIHYVLTNKPNVDLTIYGNSSTAYFFNNKQDILDSINRRVSFVIGGNQVYNLFKNEINEMFITRINKEFDCDTFFPEWNWKDYTLAHTSSREYLSFSRYIRNKNEY